MRTSLLFFALACFAVAQTPTLSPTAPIVTVGNSVTITSSTNVTWSLAGAGTLSNQTPTSVTFTAPASIVPNSTMLGCPVLPNDAIFNTRIDSLPVDSNSATWNAHSSTLPLNFSTAWGITYADSTTSSVTIKPYYGDTSGNSVNYSIPFPGRTKLKRENGNFISHNVTNDDNHVLIVQKDACGFYEYYNEIFSLTAPEFSLTQVCQTGPAVCNAASATTPYKSATFAMPTSATDAAGLELAPLTWTLSDIKNGIKHAARFTTSIGFINSVEWPATDSNVQGNTGAAPYGARFRLKTPANGGPNVTTICTSNTVLNQACVNMLTGLQQYGMILADVGAGNSVIIGSDASEDPTIRQAMSLIQAANITQGAGSFDVVDESSLQQTAAKGYQIPTSGSYAVDPTNSYITPSNYALITATPTTGSPVKISVALEGVGIGLQSNTMAIAAGMSGYQIPSWVTPSTASQTVTWTETSSTCTGDSITSGGIYTPPASGAPCTATLTATATADSNVHAILYVSVVGNNSGTYSIDLASIPSGSTSTSPSKTWYNDFGAEVSDGNFYPSADYPVWSKNGTALPESVQYGSYLYTYGGDINYTLVLPNGNYQVRWMIGQPWNGSPWPQGSYPQNFAHSPNYLGVNGNIVSHLYDPDWASGYQWATPADTYIPAKVTNNVLTTTLYTVSPDDPIVASSGLAPLYYSAANPVPFPNFCKSTLCAKGTQAEGIEIIPDSSTPHWQIDSQGVKTIHAAQYIQLYVQDWYTGDSDINSATWKVSSGIGATITSSGLLFLPSGTFLNGQPVTVTASGASHSASLTLYTAGGAKYAANPIPKINHYIYVRALTIDHTKVLANQTNFPVLISITDKSLATSSNGGHVQNNNGYDIVFASNSSGTPSLLKWDLESYNPSSGTIVAHVQLPSLSSTANTTIYMFYGNPAIAAAQNSPTAVWDSNFVAVYHFSNLTADATANGNNATLGSSVSSTTGKFANAALISGTAISTAPAAVIGAAKGSIEEWMDISNSASGYDLGDERGGNAILQFFQAASPMTVGWYPNEMTTTANWTSILNGWHHLAYTWDWSVPAQYAYIDGVQVASNTTSALSVTAGGVYDLGGFPNYNGVGSMDESRFSNIARSASWIQTEFNSYNSPGTFFAFGAESSN